MKTILALLFAVFSHAAQAWDSWTPEQRRWYMASNAMLVADWAITRDMTRRYHEGYYERNIVLGRYPSRDRLDLYFVSALIGHYFIADSLSNDWRTVYLQVVTAVEAGAVANNLSIGLRLRF
jgi:hypothetical protein